MDELVDCHFELTERLLTRGGEGLPVLLPAHRGLAKQMVCLLQSKQSRSFPTTQPPGNGFVAVLSETEEGGGMMSPDGVSAASQLSSALITHRMYDRDVEPFKTLIQDSIPCGLIAPFGLNLG